jgi:hypothetical protein
VNGSNTKRTPINRPARRRFSPETLDLFRQMRDLECSCKRRWVTRKDGHGGYWGHTECRDCTVWNKLHSQLLVSLSPRPKPWEYPAVQDLNGHGGENSEELTRALEAALEARDTRI